MFSPMSMHSILEPYIQESRIPDEGWRVHGQNVTPENVDKKNSPTVLHTMINMPHLTKIRFNFLVEKKALLPPLFASKQLLCIGG